MEGNDPDLLSVTTQAFTCMDTGSSSLLARITTFWARFDPGTSQIEITSAKKKR
jgi:hypothetical protein